MCHAASEKQQPTPFGPKRDKIRTFGEKEPNKCLGILETDTIKQLEIKEKIKKEYFRGTRKLHETKLYSWNLIKGINNLAVPLENIRDHPWSGP